MEITEYTREFDISVSIFAYDEPSLDLALDLKPDLLKLNSSEPATHQCWLIRPDLVFRLLLGQEPQPSTRSRKPFMKSWERRRKSHFNAWCPKLSAPIDTANIAKIRRLKDEFGGIIIYADHTNANEEIAKWIDLMAILLVQQWWKNISF